MFRMGCELKSYDIPSSLLQIDPNCSERLRCDDSSSISSACTLSCSISNALSCLIPTSTTCSREARVRACNDSAASFFSALRYKSTRSLPSAGTPSVSSAPVLTEEGRDKVRRDWW